MQQNEFWTPNFCCSIASSKNLDSSLASDQATFRLRFCAMYVCMYEIKFSTAGHTDCVQLLEQWGMSHKGGNLPSTEMSMAETFVSMFTDNLSQVSCDS